MRLGQLSRKLEVTTTDISNYLSENGFDVKDHPNVKLDPDLEEKVVAHFSEEPLIEDEKPVAEPEISAQPEEEFSSAEMESPKEARSEVIPAEQNETPQHEKQPEETLNEGTENDDRDDGGDEEPEVIRAPKVELQGLKVVGKIDLPEPTPKDKEEEETEKQKEEEDPDQVKVVRHSRKNSRKKLTPEEREARRIRNKKAKEKRLKKQREKQKERELRQLKKKKEQHYKQKINKDLPAASSKVKKKKKEKKQAMENTTPKPKTLMGKFWRWLNT